MTKRTSQRRLFAGSLVILCGCLALAAPFALGKLAHAVLGLLMLAFGLAELVLGYWAAEHRQRRSILFGSVVSTVVGLLLLAMPQLATSGVVILLGLSFALDGMARVWSAVRSQETATWGVAASDGVFSVLLGVLIALQWPVTGIVSLGLMVGLRMLSAGWSMLFVRTDSAAHAETDDTERHPDSRLGMPPHSAFGKERQTWEAGLNARRAIDRYWVIVFVLVFFAIHVGRMDVEWTFVGFLSPGVAVVGDVCIAVILTWCVVIPARMAWRGLTRPAERRAWRQFLAADTTATENGRSLARRLVRTWLTLRYGFSARLRKARRSPTTAVAWGLQIGLPLTAVLIALNPIWGMTWYFNTENWATGAWEKWTEYRVDDWRAAMIKEVEIANANASEAELFRVTPPGVASSEDFTFIVIGDTGEGDESQHVLRDRFILLGQRPDVRFLVVSSDVIYPSGAMKDYEPKFYLPFKGFTKPIYAIPGNHDWYDALDAFAANFFAPSAARAAMRARRTADHGLTSTTETKIERMVQEAAQLRKTYQVQTGLQQAPFLEIQTDRFALILVDTGILKTIDKEQERWLVGALERSRNKFTMAILGHPLYAGGHDQGVGDSEFARLHQLMREHRVDICMAGDTHYFEYYRENHESGGQQTMHHFVNGGGGAYLSIGTGLDWPKQPPVADCGFYPRTDAITTKLDNETPAWKWPMWFWVKRFGAWPSTVEALAPAFDFNRAPFYQSFAEVRVEFSTNTVRVIPHGPDGPLKWRDMQLYGRVMPSNRSAEDSIEFTVPMSATVR